MGVLFRKILDLQMRISCFDTKFLSHVILKEKAFTFQQIERQFLGRRMVKCSNIACCQYWEKKRWEFLCLLKMSEFEKFIDNQKYQPNKQKTHVVAIVGFHERQRKVQSKTIKKR